MKPSQLCIPLEETREPLGHLGTFLQQAFISSMMQSCIPCLGWQTAKYCLCGSVRSPFLIICPLPCFSQITVYYFVPIAFYFFTTLLFTCKFPHFGFFAQHHFNIPFQYSRDFASFVPVQYLLPMMQCICGFEQVIPSKPCVAICSVEGGASP